MQFDRNTKLFWTSSDNSGCSELRSRLPSEFLKQHFDWVKYSSGFPAGNPELMEANIIHLQRANHEYFQTWMPEAKAAGIKVIHDMDDLLWGIPASNLAWKYYPNSELKKLDKVLSMSDVLTASTVPLQEFMQNRFKDKEVFLLPNHIPLNPMGEKPENDKIKICWAGSYTHRGDFDNHLVDAIRYITSTYKDKLEFYCIGYLPPFFKNMATFIPWIETTQYHNTFYSYNFDIGVIVAENNAFNTCKSNLKFMEYSNCKCASIAQKVYPYETTIEQGVDGFIVNTPKTDWKAYLVELIENTELRKSMQDAAYKKVAEKFTFEGDGENILNNYKKIFSVL